MRKNTIAILAVMAVLVIGGMFAIEQRTMHHRAGGRGMQRRGEMAPMKFLGRLGLTDEQKGKVKEILESNKGTVQPIRDELRTNHEKLAVLGGNFDEQQVSTIAREQGELMSQLIVARQRVKSQIFAILSDDQKAKAEQIRQNLKRRFRDKMKSFGGEERSGDE